MADFMDEYDDLDELPVPCQVQVVGNSVELVDRFTYIGSQIDHNRGSEVELLRRIAITRD